MQAVLRLPLIVLLSGIGAAAMIVPALVALAVEDFATARPFFYGAILFLTLTALVGLATARYQPQNGARSHLLALVATFTVLPIMLAVPFAEAVPNTRFLNVYFEMVSSLTTTGATVFEATRLPLAIHIWRALVGWMGGFLIWITAFAILAPMTLGGFEVTSAQEAGTGAMRRDVRDDIDPTARLLRYTLRLFPVYAGLTIMLWLLLVLASDPPAIAAIHAMSTIATSGITSLPSFAESPGGISGEVLIFVFFIFALTRRSFLGGFSAPMWGLMASDRELRLAALLILGLPLMLFLRHFFGAWDVDETLDPQALPALWGGIFTVASFLTTTGFESQYWSTARDWSGLGTPGFLLAGMAVMGGGVATTAGGVKLLRVYALYKHGLREMDRLVHPSSVGGQGQMARRMRREGASIAWVFFMIFALSIAVVMTGLAAAGLGFEDAVILAVSALSTTGPVALIAGGEPISYAALPDAAKLIIAAAMVLGRLETLAIIALLNPDFWRP